MLGKPVVAGPRILVERSLEKLAAGETPEDLYEAYPNLTRSHSSKNVPDSESKMVSVPPRTGR